MRILMTNWVYLPEFSGAALQCHRLSKALQRQGVQVNVLTGTHERAMAGTDRIDNIPVHRVLRDVSSLRGQIRYFRVIQSFIRQHHHLFDIIHTHGFHPRVNLVVSKYEKPIIQKITALGLDDPVAVQSRPLGALKSRLQRQAKAIVPTSEILESRCKQGNVPPHCVVPIPNGVETDVFHPVSAAEKAKLRQNLDIPGDKIVLLMVGSVTFRKGLDMLIQALYGLNSTIKKKIKVLIVGPTINQHSLGQFDYEFFDYTQRMKLLIGDLGLKDMIEFRGRKRNVNEYMQAADIFVHPSRNEGQPGALLEAMAVGMPVLVNLLPGITDEIVQAGRYGYLVNCTDIPVFTAALRVLIKNNNLRRRLGEQARRRICERYDMDVIAGKYITLYSQLINHQSDQRSEPEKLIKGHFKNDKSALL